MLSRSHTSGVLFRDIHIQHSAAWDFVESVEALLETIKVYKSTIDIAAGGQRFPRAHRFPWLVWESGTRRISFWAYGVTTVTDVEIALLLCTLPRFIFTGKRVRDAPNVSKCWKDDGSLIDPKRKHHLQWP